MQIFWVYSFFNQLELDMFLGLILLLIYQITNSVVTGKSSSNVDLASCNLVDFPKLFGDLDELAALLHAKQQYKVTIELDVEKKKSLNLSVSHNSDRLFGLILQAHMLRTKKCPQDD